MAGMGPPPKRPGTRQRRNRTVAGALLPAAGRSSPAPPLPDRPCPCDEMEECAACGGSGVLPWLSIVVDQWETAWASPMAVEWLRSDVHGLFIVADLWDQYWRGDKDKAGEIRLQEQRFGLSSLDRRRLQWEIEKVEQAQKRRPATAKPKGRAADPLRFLRAIK